MDRTPSLVSLLLEVLLNPTVLERKVVMCNYQAPNSPEMVGVCDVEKRRGSGRRGDSVEPIVVLLGRKRRLSRDLKALIRSRMNLEGREGLPPQPFTGATLEDFRNWFNSLHPELIG
jgi:hypothetical protein